MAVTNFLRDVWSANILRLLALQAVWADLGSREYEPEFLGARKVRINAISETSVTVKDYTRNADIDDPEQLDDSQIVFTLDKEKYFNFAVDDVDAAQTNADLLQAGNEVAAEAMTKVIEQDVANMVVSEIPNANIITLNDQFKAASTLEGIPKDGTDLDDLLADHFGHINVKLTQGNVKNTLAPWAVHSPYTWAGITHGLTDKGSNLFTTGLSREVLENGFKGRLHDIDHFESNIEPVKTAATSLGGDTTTTTSSQGSKDRTIVIGFPGAFAYAGPIESIEPYRPEKRFGDAVKGLYVYGVKVLRPSLMFALKFATT